MEKEKKRIPFSLRLFWSILLIFLGFCICFLLFQYQREREYTEEKLHNVLVNYNHQLYRRHKQTDNIELLVRQFIDEIPQEELRVTIIEPDGKVCYDNSGLEDFDNHNNRSEVHLARRKGEGFAIRSSGSTGIRYFYSASDINGYIYRSALPYDLYVMDALTINIDFVYFMAFMVILFFIVLSRFTFSIDRTISNLRDFARNVKEDSISDMEVQFPNDELGDIAKNITTLYRQQQEVKEEEVRIKKQLTQNIAHELKTPVSCIQGYLETILTSSEMTEEKKEFFLERCYAQSSRLADLLRDISVLNRLDEASAMFEITQVDINRLLEEIETTCTQEMSEKQITAEIILPQQVTVFGNHSLLYSIFHNLFDNTIAYAGEGVHIKIECYREDESFYYFSYADNGIGIDEKQLNRIFERFYRIDKGRSRKLGGTGLGLSIVKNSVHFHKGQITATSRPAEGVTFHFSLKKTMSDNNT